MFLSLTYNGLAVGAVRNINENFNENHKMQTLLKELKEFCRSKGLEEREAAYLIGLFTKHEPALRQTPVSGSALPDGWMDWNTLSIDQMVEHLRKKYMFSSSGDAKCIYHLIEFYDKHK